MVLQRLSLRGVAKATKCFNCEGINYGIATSRTTSRGCAASRFNCEGINYGIATPGSRRPRADPSVSIVKISTMVLQHIHVGRPFAVVGRVSIVKISTIVLQLVEGGADLVRLESFNCEDIDYGIARLMSRRGWRSQTATVRCSPGIPPPTARP